MIRPLPLVLLLAAACAPAPPVPVARGLGPPDARPGACYARGLTPAVIETVTEQVQEAPERRDAAGRVVAPARFVTQTSTRILRARGENWFETPCALRAGSADFIAQVQRALAARALYGGAITGVYDAATRRAVRAYQTPRGLDSGTLSLEAAKSLGLVALGRDGV
ncbi:peptidoglycan-binding domain-containing protein [Jannaschia ovalis]|uniref:Peptidoglycan-binding domain-containing protein n=1 Tax=Jannaschia ovalis TaxID=3038773 RepID=A0ABY8LEJ7_9RHOB|nr:peptidoglycan-binding domain-containing protein [Jannaschia sp. GRR-S6-38]WGH79717.1 peptidoglycan-binding domain-containing protein [Jannaschia sp. GRR-S6-38]